MQPQPWSPEAVYRCGRTRGHWRDPLTGTCRQCHGEIPPFLLRPAAAGPPFPGPRRETPSERPDLDRTPEAGHRLGSNGAPCPISSCAESVVYQGSSMVSVEPGGYAPDFGKYVHVFAHDGEEGHVIAVTTDETAEHVLERLSGTRDHAGALLWGQS